MRVWIRAPRRPGYARRVKSTIDPQPKPRGPPHEAQQNKGLQACGDLARHNRDAQRQGEHEGGENLKSAVVVFHDVILGCLCFTRPGLLTQRPAFSIQAVANSPPLCLSMRAWLSMARWISPMTACFFWRTAGCADKASSISSCASLAHPGRAGKSPLRSSSSRKTWTLENSVKLSPVYSFPEFAEKRILCFSPSSTISARPSALMA